MEDPRIGRRYSMHMVWHDLLFMHWPLPVHALQPLLPAELELDTFDGEAWLGVVPFRMSGIRHRGLPALPGLAAFPELNVRTYVRHRHRRGVYFFSLDATHRIAVQTARLLFCLPYRHAAIRCEMDDSGCVQYRSRRRVWNTRDGLSRDDNRAMTATVVSAPAVLFEATYEPIGDAFHAKPGDLAHFLTERYCFLTANRRGEICRCDIDHPPWPLQPARCEVRVNTMTLPLGVSLPDAPPLLHFARRLDVRAWRLTRDV